MPFVKIYHHENLSYDELKLISNSIHSSLINNFNVPTKDLFHLCLPLNHHQFVFDKDYNLSVNEIRTCKLIYIDILCGNGRSSHQKEALFLNIVNNITSCTQMRPADIFITIKESSKENWSFGEGKQQMMNKENVYES
jgi:hypothetical protein